MSHREAQESHAAVSDALDKIKETASTDATSGQAFDSKTVVAHMFADFASRMNEIDSEGAAAVIDSFKTYLKGYDSLKCDEIYNIKDYLVFRELNAGHG